MDTEHYYWPCKSQQNFIPAVRPEHVTESTTGNLKSSAETSIEDDDRHSKELQKRLDKIQSYIIQLQNTIDHKLKGDSYRDDRDKLQAILCEQKSQLIKIHEELTNATIKTVRRERELSKKKNKRKRTRQPAHKPMVPRHWPRNALSLRLMKSLKVAPILNILPIEDTSITTWVMFYNVQDLFPVTLLKIFISRKHGIEYEKLGHKPLTLWREEFLQKPGNSAFSDFIMYLEVENESVRVQDVRESKARIRAAQAMFRILLKPFGCKYYGEVIEFIAYEKWKPAERDVETVCLEEQPSDAGVSAALGSLTEWDSQQDAQLQHLFEYNPCPAEDRVTEPAAVSVPDVADTRTLAPPAEHRDHAVDTNTTNNNSDTQYPRIQASAIGTFTPASDKVKKFTKVTQDDHFIYASYDKLLVMWDKKTESVRTHGSSSPSYHKYHRRHRTQNSLAVTDMVRVKVKLARMKEVLYTHLQEADNNSPDSST